MNNLVVTLDLDWACEPAIEETLDFLNNQHITPTVFITHRSPRVEASMDLLEVGLHPYFGPNSSHGTSVTEVVKYIMDLPHNLLAFRCHRFAICNVSRQAMAEAGMLISSNVCTDLEIVLPFTDRFGFLEVPIFLEDGGYLWRQHSLAMNQQLKNTVLGPGTKILIIHPMHFVLNTPHFDYMKNIKQSRSPKAWRGMTKRTINQLRWKGRGIKDLLIDLLALRVSTLTLGALLIRNNLRKQTA